MRGGSPQAQLGAGGGLRMRGRFAKAALLVLAFACDLSFGDMRAYDEALGTLFAERVVRRRECVSLSGSAVNDNATDDEPNVAGVNNLTLTPLSIRRCSVLRRTGSARSGGKVPIRVPLDVHEEHLRKQHLHGHSVPQQMGHHGCALRRPGGRRTSWTDTHSPLRFQRSSAKCLRAGKSLCVTSGLYTSDILCRH